MANRDLSELNSFVMNMGGKATSKKIPVVYREDTRDIVVETSGKITDKRKRYSNGETVIFKCKDCNDIIGKGKITNESEDKVKIYCFNCNNYHECEKAIIWSKETLWYKPENKEQRKDYEKLMTSYLESKDPKVLTI